MRIKSRHLVRIGLCLLSLGALGFLLFFPALPWSIQLRHSLRKALVKTEIRIARLRGRNPHLISIAGKVSIPGARIESLDSTSGWAATADLQGNFVLPAEMWYPGAKYDLIVTGDAYNTRYVRVGAPAGPLDSRLDLGALPAESSCRVDSAGLPGVNSVSFVDYDSGNVDFYQQTFDRLTAGMMNDEDKMLAILAYVHSKLDYEQGAGDFQTPRATMERGSRYCGCLSLAMAALAEGGGYKARVIHLSDEATPPVTHGVTEVYYRDRWHLFDPTLGIRFLNAEGQTASHKEIRLDPTLVDRGIGDLDAETRADASEWLPAVYESGIYHYFCFRKKETREIWWPFSYAHTVSAAGLIDQALPMSRITRDLLQRAIAAGEKTHTQGVCRRCDIRAGRAKAQRP